MKNKSSYLIIYMLLGLVAGMLSPIQTSINSELRSAIQSPLVAALVSFSVGTLALILLVLILEHHRLVNTNLLEKGKMIISGSPWWLWIGGMLGVIFVTSNIFLLPIIGAALTVVLALCGQMVIALIIDHFGWFGVPKHPINRQRIFGIILMIAGIFLIQHF
ncbi:DMT family transporter [Sporolactobacillus kofuensis]|uniref:DMT family transporter n=1 Tax=Sporolactobacillus kofuensis TaxID=269672 RepID=A0ABW1WEK3_9BACL|nr:DMT family transporter [Sporolactobacillus kofuensis]MCO7175223.1 DMT family transporter [Sporolactobacillus kofuensis]